MLSESELAKFLARRDKRVKYLRGAFQNGDLPADDRKEALELLDTYSLLLAKLHQGSGSDDMDEVYQRVLTIDRDLTRLFEHSRLLTAR